MQGGQRACEQRTPLRRNVAGEQRHLVAQGRAAAGEQRSPLWHEVGSGRGATGTIVAQGGGRAAGTTVAQGGAAAGEQRTRLRRKVAGEQSTTVAQGGQRAPPYVARSGRVSSDIDHHCGARRGNGRGAENTTVAQVGG